jgi:two-component system chemotaxis sensor kinase CheA
MSTTTIPTGAVLSDAMNDELLESFLVEAREILETLGHDLVDLEKRPADAELLNKIFRGVHTLKGTSSFLGLSAVSDLAHEYEDLLNKLRKGVLQVRPSMMDVMLEAADQLRKLVAAVEHKETTPHDCTATVERLHREIRGEAAPAAVVAETPEATKSSEAKSADLTIRVDVSRLDHLMNLVGELVLARNRLSQTAAAIGQELVKSERSAGLQEASTQVDFITTELQMAVMKTRMVPVARLFNRLPRLVRDLSRETGKAVDLQIYGEETELDKSIIEELNDPLVHLIRNAVDHGIEPEAERRAAHKDPGGTIVVNAEHQGNHIVISIEDDGRGIDPQRLRQKAVEKGLLSPAQAADLSDRDAVNLIFAPGFSTAATVTSISGRGVGMDVVRSNIARLKGIIDVQSQPGHGTLITLKVPLTLAIIQGLLVRVAQEIFAIPLASVLEVVRVHRNDLQTVHGRWTIRLRDSVLPLVSLGDILRVPGSQHDNPWLYVVVVGWADQRTGLVVDAMMGQREVVIKSLGDYLSNTTGIAGSTILGDGRTILIVDVGQLMSLVGGRTAEGARVHSQATV